MLKHWLAQFFRHNAQQLDPEPQPSYVPFHHLGEGFVDIINQQTGRSFHYIDPARTVIEHVLFMGHRKDAIGALNHRHMDGYFGKS